MKNEKPSAGGAKQTETQMGHRNVVWRSIISFVSGVITMVLLAMPFLILTDTRYSSPTTFSMSGYDLVLPPPINPGIQPDHYSSYELLWSTGNGFAFLFVWLVAATGIILISIGVGAALGRPPRKWNPAVLSGALMIFGSSVILVNVIGWIFLQHANPFKVLPGCGLLVELAVGVAVYLAGSKISSSTT